ncbi:tryptophan-rich sensory protein [Nocardioides sp. BP30]|uniref:TspO/MBR family protein n=1 Tax=Nocardioides sp. BP30 TaxID=3036374 RepID=UPI002468EB2F|nr:tryptophan-rich sensory protein [Nocardioides sp. BP30]WGL51372.1 tryptophan-rich sensory protein [Nocardioides sp. BP30]
MFRNTLAATTGAVAATALVGGVASKETSGPWYGGLRKPAIQPPAAAFPVVWTALYAGIAVASAVALEKAEATTARSYRRALGANLVLNASWTWVFFKAHRIGPATGVAAALALSSTDLARRAGRIDRRTGWGLAPYAGWCGFATVLTAAIGRANADR